MPKKKTVDYDEPVFKIDKQTHEEGHGDRWNALGFSGEEEIVNLIKICLQEGSITEEDILNKPKEYPISIIHPVESPIKICSLLAKKRKNHELVSAYPIFEGLLNDVTIGDKYTWENKTEGEVEITNINGFENFVFAPFFVQNSDNFEKGTKTSIYLSGLAYNIQDAPMEFEVGEGDFYEEILKEFLDENPKKNKDDFSNPIIRMDGLVMLFPTETHTLYEYRGTILTLETIDFFDKKISRAKVCIKRTEDEEKMHIFLYISPDRCLNCKLEIGKDIMGIIELQGYR